MAIVRLQKVLADRGVASRRKAEDLIAQGVVKVNGHPAKIGDKVDDRHDLITVHGKRIAEAETPLYIVLHKPRGYITTLQDEQGRRCVADLVKNAGARVYPVGRLDRESEGLLLMTNDGDFSNAMMHPSAHVPKRYRVTVRAAVTDEQVQAMRDGIMLDGRKTLPAEVTVETAEEATADKPARSVLNIVLYEGRNREIRRMCEELQLEVVRLKRIAIGPLKLGQLPVGSWRFLKPQEVKALVQAANVKDKIAADYIKGKGSVPHGDYRPRR